MIEFLVYMAVMYAIRTSIGYIQKKSNKNKELDFPSKWRYLMKYLEINENGKYFEIKNIQERTYGFDVMLTYQYPLKFERLKEYREYFEKCFGAFIELKQEGNYIKMRIIRYPSNEKLINVKNMEKKQIS